MRVARTIAEARESIAQVRKEGRRIGFVPTMGYLHEGHLSLIRRCRGLSDFVVLSIYVNPLQFGPHEDFDTYPRDVEHDLALAEDEGVDLVFLPSDAELHPSELTVSVRPRRLADRLCGLGRPGHFEGVLTVVAKLFGIITPDVSIFGQKDFQQSVLINKLVTDLNIPVEIVVAPTVREEDGLAMSSRNKNLPPAERERALSLSRGLALAVEAYRGGERDAARLREAAAAAMEATPGVRIEYAELVSADDLEPMSRADDYSVVAIAAHVDGTRLIDNVTLSRPDPGLERLLQKGADLG